MGWTPESTRRILTLLAGAAGSADADDGSVVALIHLAVELCAMANGAVTGMDRLTAKAVVDRIMVALTARKSPILQ